MRPRTTWLYALALMREFRATLLAVTLLVLAAAVLFAATPHASLEGRRPDALLSLYAAWMALFGEPVLGAPERWYLALVDGLYPLLGFALVGEGVVHFGLLMVSRRRGEKEWTRVMVSTYREHVVLCGLGKLGTRVLDELLAQGHEVVVIEKDEHCRFLAHARALRVPVLLRDMSEDQALVEAGVPFARAIVLASNADVANLEAAMDARRLNPSIRVVMRLYDQRLAEKLASVFGIDAAFSSTALAAPAVAGMTLGTRVLATCTIAGVPHATAELDVEAGASLERCSVADIESAHGVRVLARTPREAAAESPPAADTRLAAGDRLVLHARVDQLATLAQAARG